MGVFSKHHRFHEAGEEANVNNVERFGVPAHSLFTTTKVFTLHHHIDIMDENEQVVYQSNSKVISLHDKTDITTAAGAQVRQDLRKDFLHGGETGVVVQRIPDAAVADERQVP